LIGQALAPAANVSGQEQSHNRIRLGPAYERGYVAGYADGFSAGKNDYASGFNRNFRRNTLYFEADRGYESLSGSFADYQEGYRWGFEVAYLDGYSRRAYDSRIPPNVAQIERSMALSPGHRDRERTTIRSLIPEGAAIGAIIGAGAGAGSVYVQGGKVDPGTQIIIFSNQFAGPYVSRLELWKLHNEWINKGAEHHPRIN
jgi:hypothetical protein